MSEWIDDPAGEQRRFAVLDAYVADLQAGRARNRGELLAEHPELAGALECLEALHQFGSPCSPTAAAPDCQPTVTSDYQPGSATTTTAPTGASSLFGGYELLEEVGRGGMGVVFKARQLDLDRIVALKMILAGQLASGDQSRRFHAEARIAARLRHPHIVQIHEAGAVHGQPYFAMEYIEGQSLAGLLQGGPLPPAAAAAHLAAVARGVAYLHEQGIIHRDIKPSNVLVDGRGRPVLTDFGLVKVLDADNGMTGTGAILGTPSYMAPEQAASRPDVGPACDVYSLGALLYELLTGQPPFRGPTQMETLVQVLESEPTPPSSLRSGLPRELELICLKCLEKDPARRYGSAAGLADDLERFLRGEATEARSNRLGLRLRRWARREPALLAHLAVLGLSAAMVQVNHWVGGSANRALHWYVEALLGAWALVSLLCQAFLRQDRRPDLVRIAWLGADAVFLTGVLMLVGAAAGPLGVSYAVFIAASGLWCEARLVWLTTGLSLGGYMVLLGAALARGSNVGNPLHQTITLAILGALGGVIAYQVQRFQLISRYCEKRT